MIGHSLSPRRPPAALLALALLAVACAAPPEPAPEPEFEGSDWIRRPTANLPPRLSQIGAFVDLEAEQPADGVHPYDVRYPRYAGSHDSRRWVFVPTGATIDGGESGRWSFPPGALLLKTFYTGSSTETPGLPIETRVIYRGPSEWKARSYRWQASGQEAVLVDGLADIELSLPDSVTSYTIPKSLSCQSCHKHEDGWVLGFNGLQLEMPPEDDSAQLARLAGEGVFPSPGVPPFTSIEASSPLEREVLGYWQGNCVSCHRPGATAYNTTELDLRHASALENTIAARPLRLGTTDPEMRLIAPRRPEKSLLYILTSGAYPDPAMRMPQLGMGAIDTLAIDRLRQWIDTL
jgi:hypothetical protein